MDLGFRFFFHQTEMKVVAYEPPHTSGRTFGAPWSYHSYHNTVRADVHDANSSESWWCIKAFCIGANCKKKRRRKTVYFRRSTAAHSQSNTSCIQVTVILKVRESNIICAFFFCCSAAVVQILEKFHTLHFTRTLNSGLSWANAEFMGATCGSAPTIYHRLMNSKTLSKLLQITTQLSRSLGEN